MKLYDIPGLNGYKTAIGGWALIIGGLGAFLVSLGKFLDGTGELQPVIESLFAVSAGISALGIGHKMEKKKEALATPPATTPTYVPPEPRTGD